MPNLESETWCKLEPEEGKLHGKELLKLIQETGDDKFAEALEKIDPSIIVLTYPDDPSQPGGISEILFLGFPDTASVEVTSDEIGQECIRLSIPPDCQEQYGGLSLYEIPTSRLKTDDLWFNAWETNPIIYARTRRYDQSGKYRGVLEPKGDFTSKAKAQIGGDEDDLRVKTGTLIVMSEPLITQMEREFDIVTDSSRVIISSILNPHEIQRD